ncbi:hypothetical protein ILYODFUR_017009 [Ilyodon furcidens]|uniref:Uncharacterized protein n=1 Tax=Ilyodon furcidens TaxID=33524 RepID=A0ABV0USM2_9TELE
MRSQKEMKKPQQLLFSLNKFLLCTNTETLQLLLMTMMMLCLRTEVCLADMTQRYLTAPCRQNIESQRRRITG